MFVLLKSLLFLFILLISFVYARRKNGEGNDFYLSISEIQDWSPDLSVEAFVTFCSKYFILQQVIFPYWE